MKTETDLLIIGAGPFGLAVAADATHRGMNYRIVGKPMEFWIANMPKGMYLRSACDWHLDPAGIDTIESFLKSQHLTAAQVEPVSLDFYLRYAAWFQQRKGIEPLPLRVSRLDHAAPAGAFEAFGEDGSIITARNVVIAIGFKYFKHLPADIAQRVPSGRLAHTCDLVEFGPLRGRRCLIIGGRQSAFEWAALIAEAGASAVHVCHRHDSPAFKMSDWSWVGPLVDATAQDTTWFRKLPAARQEDMRQRLWAEGRLKIEPWLEPRIHNHPIKLWPRSELTACTERADGSLAATLDNGETLHVDQVIAATGYKVDLARVPFLAEGNLKDRLATRNGFPELDDHFETNVAGLFMTSMPATQDFGPFWAFTVSARVSAQILGRRLSGDAVKRAAL